MRLIIDRFEGSFAVCEKEDRTFIQIERTNIPEDAKEGDIIIINGEKVTIDVDATKNRKEAIEKETKDLWNE